MPTMPTATDSVRKNFSALIKYIESSCVIEHFDSHADTTGIGCEQDNYDRNVLLLCAVLKEEIPVQAFVDALSKTGQRFAVDIIAGSGDATLKREQAYEEAIQPRFTAILKAIQDTDLTLEHITTSVPDSDVIKCLQEMIKKQSIPMNKAFAILSAYRRMGCLEPLITHLDNELLSNREKTELSEAALLRAHLREIKEQANARPPESKNYTLEDIKTALQDQQTASKKKNFFIPLRSSYELKWSFSCFSGMLEFPQKFLFLHESGSYSKIFKTFVDMLLADNCYENPKLLEAFSEAVKQNKPLADVLFQAPLPSSLRRHLPQIVKFMYSKNDFLYFLYEKGVINHFEKLQEIINISNSKERNRFLATKIMFNPNLLEKYCLALEEAKQPELAVLLRKGTYRSLSEDFPALRSRSDLLCKKLNPSSALLDLLEEAEIITPYQREEAEIITPYQRQEIQAITNLYDTIASSKLLDIFGHCPIEKKSKLENALKSNDQLHIWQLIQDNYTSEELAKWKRIDEQHVTCSLLRRLKLTDEFLAHLLEKKIISSCQKDALSAMPNNTEKDKHERNSQFLTILGRRSLENLESLHELLMNVNHGAQKDLISLIFDQTSINGLIDKRINEQLSRLAYICASAKQGCIEESPGSNVFANDDIMQKLAESMCIDETRNVQSLKERGISELPRKIRQRFDSKTKLASTILSDKQNSTENPSLNPLLGHSFFSTASKKQTDTTDIDEATCTKQARFS
jgi:hypothetical protein